MKTTSNWLVVKSYTSLSGQWERAEVLALNKSPPSPFQSANRRIYRSKHVDDKYTEDAMQQPIHVDRPYKKRRCLMYTTFPKDPLVLGLHTPGIPL